MNTKTVFITGAATGIGLATARKLDQQGWIVFGGAMPDQDVTDLLANASERLTVVFLDTTDDGLVNQAVEQVGEQVGEAGLYGLINNAGIAHIGSGVIAGVNLDQARALFEVNVLGTVRVTQAFLPLLHQFGAARIVNLSSGAVRVPVPTAGIYNMSKSAIEGFTKTLRYELAPFGIEVTAIEPGGVRTPMTANAETNMQKVWDSMSSAVRARYESVLKPVNKNLAKQLETANDPDFIADGIIHALTTANPRPRYTIGKEVTLLPFLQKVLSEPLFERLLLGQFGLKKGSVAPQNGKNNA